MVHLQNVIKNNHIITKDYELEPFWHVYAVDAKYDVVGEELVTRFKARPGYRRKDNGEIKSLPKDSYSSVKEDLAKDLFSLEKSNTNKIIILTEGKSDKKKKQMAVAAYLSKQND